MIWLDITDPKYVLFFKNLIPLLKNLDEVIVTTRKSKDYDECYKLLKLFQIDAISLGGYGGLDKLDKFNSRLKRQSDFLKLFQKTKIPKIFITGVSVEGTQTAFALGIPIIQFSDTPLANDFYSKDKVTVVAKLTLPLSNLIFRPFLVPEKCYSNLGIESKNIIPYNFIDVAVWLKNLPKGNDFRKKYKLDSIKPTILIREEEYKAHYVKEKNPIIYDCINALQNFEVNLVLMPRYGVDDLKEKFSHIRNLTILEDKLPPQDFYPFIDMLIGGGGTMNLESCYFGIPTISTRSLFLFHDKYLLDNNLMYHCKNSQEVLDIVKKHMQSGFQRKNYHYFFEKGEANFEKIFLEIKKRFYS